MEISLGPLTKEGTLVPAVVVDITARKKMEEQLSQRIEAIGGLAGLPGVWRTELLRLQTEDSDPYEIAALHAWLGDKEQTFTWLQKAYDRHSPLMEEANQDAAFDNIRSDPRYSALLHRLKLQ